MEGRVRGVRAGRRVPRGTACRAQVPVRCPWYRRGVGGGRRGRDLPPRGGGRPPAGGAAPRAPPRVVCDNDDGLTKAIRARFPCAELYLCEWHLRHALERLMRKIRSDEPQHRRAIDQLLADVEAAFTGPAFWDAFRNRAHAA